MTFPTDPTDPTEHSTRKLGLGMIVIAWALVIGVLVIFFDDWLDGEQNPNQRPSSSELAGGLIEVVLMPNRQHHYLVNGRINDQPMTFLLDTGATDVVIPAALAQRLRLQQGQRRQAITANGVIDVYSTRLDSLHIGDIALRDVRASINPAMQQDVVLLGMSALKQIEFTQRGETLILRQYPPP